MAPVASTNRIELLQDRVIKHYGPKRPYGKYYLRCALHRLGLRQPVEYWPAGQRRDFEAETLALWHAHGFLAPQVISRGNDMLEMSRLSGLTLQQLAAAPGQDDFWSALDAVITDINRRHELALRQGEARLCHIDANPRNILIDRGQVQHVDFEMGRPGAPVEDWAGRELSKFVTSLLGVLPQNATERFLRRFASAYAERAVLVRLVAAKPRGTLAPQASPGQPPAWRDICVRLQALLRDPPTLA